MVGAAGPALKDLPSPWSCGSRDSPKGDSSSRSELACAPLDDEPVSCHSRKGFLVAWGSGAFGWVGGLKFSSEGFDY